MKKEFVTITEAENISGTPRKTWYEWIKKKIVSIHTDEAGKKLLRYSDVLKIASERNSSPSPEKKESLVVSENKNEASEKKLTVSRELSKPEAERVIKVEDAIKKHRENLLLEGKLLIADEFLLVLQDFLAEAFDSQRELIERWAIEWRLTSDQLQRAKAEYNFSLRNVLSKIQKKVTNESRASEGSKDDIGSGAKVQQAAEIR